MEILVILLKNLISPLVNQVLFVCYSTYLKGTRYQGLIIVSFDTLQKICIIIHILHQNSDGPRLINQSKGKDLIWTN